MAIKRLNPEGVTLIELLIAAAILAVLASSVVMARNFVAKQTQKTSDKIYATQKAIQMFEELRAVVSQGGQAGVFTLDNYSDGSNFNNILTTDSAVTTALDPLSANITANGYDKFWRQISVLHLAQDPFARLVDVKIYGSLPGANKADTGTLLAEAGGMLRTSTGLVPPTQVYDIYELALSNELGWFTQVPNMDSAFSQAVSAVQILNQGLAIRDHHVTQTAFGRDFFYNPYINSNTDPNTGAAVANNDTIQKVMPWIYFYPGYTPQTSGTNSGTDMMFFSDAQLRAVGGVNVNGVTLSDNGYSMCDMYNTAMRYPDELAAYQAVSQNAYNANPNGTPYEMTLRMLLEKMNGQPASFMNPLLVSMHGEVLPLVNMRNYSDAAKDPLNASGSGGPNIRVVTHPDLVHYPTNPNTSGHPVSLRVYAYLDGLLNPGTLDTLGTGYPMSPNIPTVPTITLYFPSLMLKSGDVNTTAIIGGIVGGVNYKYQALPLVSGAPASQMNMYWTIANPNVTDTLITLYNTPSRCATVIAGGVTTGLYASQRLYNTEYIPCSVDANQNYSTDLTTSTNAANAKPMNTARWVITFKTQNAGVANIPDGQYAVETRIGSSTITGDYSTTSPIGPVPSGSASATQLMSDLSRTYLWIGTGSNAGVTWGGSGVTPFTERYQFNGDPRHEPYLDAKFGSVAMGTQDFGTTIDSDAYNWYWEQIGTDNALGAVADGYSGFDQSAPGFNGQPTGTGTYGDVRDMPRYYYLYQRGIYETTGVFTNLNGWTCWHASEGGEIGGTYDPFASSLKYIDTPWDPAASAVQNIDEVQDSNNWNPTAIGGVTVHSTARDVMYNNAKSLNATNTWYAKWWLGEMYPDQPFGSPVTNYAVTWMNNGNLPTTQFWRVPFEAIAAAGDTNGLDLGRHIQWGVGSVGPAAFLNGLAVGSGASTWSLASEGGSGNGQTSDITNLGTDEYNTTNFSLGSPVSAPNSRPWNCYFDIGAAGNGGNLPPLWGRYSGTRTILSVPNMAAALVANAGTNQNRIVYTSEDTATMSSIHSSPQTWESMGTVEVDYVPAANTTLTGYFNLSGMAPQGATGPPLLAQTGINTMLRTYLDAGILKAAGKPGHIPQLPLFQISTNNPANQFTAPANIVLTWASPVSTASLWTRWAGFNGGANWYTDEYPNWSTGATITSSTYTEPVTMFYVPMWSTNQTIWISAIDNATTLTAGNYFAPVALTTNTQAVTWNTPAATFPQGNYWLRVDGFRLGYPLHYSYHELQVFITR